jgi:DNA-binding NtrC family response regulator
MKKSSILLVEDDPAMAKLVTTYLRRKGLDVAHASTAAEALELIETATYTVALVDYNLPDGEAPQVVQAILQHGAAPAVYVMTSDASCARVVAAMRAGSSDVISKPFPLERLDGLVQPQQDDLDTWRAAHAPGVEGEDPLFVAAMEVARQVADTEVTVLIGGESGTGKELIARAIHAGSNRGDGPFIAINCASIPDSLIEAELFGHTRGAFTGAERAREGLLLSAHTGTLFLDEIGDMPMAAQSKLLRVLQERTITPVGSDRAIPVDVRVVAATHRDLEAMVEAGTFRADLYFRLSVVSLDLPALRDRKSDIVPLAHSFLRKATAASGRACTGFDPLAEAALVSHGWPGNVRELENTVARAVVLRRHGVIAAADLQLGGRKSRMTPPKPFAAVAAPSAAPAAPIQVEDVSHDLNLRLAMEGVEKRLIRAALERAGGNRSEAAALLGLNRTTLVEKLRKITP